MDAKMNKQVPLQFKGIPIIHAERMIPKGEYCYTSAGRCMFWDKLDGYDDQMSGYCHYLKMGDMDPDGTFLLWDQIKDCGINYIDEEYMY
jgi:hypothetical protein